MKNGDERLSRMQPLLAQSESVCDTILSLLDKPLRVAAMHPPLPADALQRAAVEVYIRAVYKAYQVDGISVDDHSGLPLAHMLFRSNPEGAVTIGVKTSDSFENLLQASTGESRFDFVLTIKRSYLSIGKQYLGVQLDKRIL